MIEPDRLSQELTALTEAPFAMTIHVQKDGLVVSIFCQSEQEDCLRTFVDYQELSGSAVEKVESIFFQHSFFSLPYKKVRVIFEPSYYVVAPSELYRDEIGQSFLDLVKDPPIGCRPRGLGSLTNPLSATFGVSSEYVFISEWDRDLELFFRRNLLGIEFQPYLIPILQEAAHSLRIQGLSGMYVVFREDGLYDVFVYEHDCLVFANVYQPTSVLKDDDKQVEEICFFILSIWKSLSLAIESVRLFIGLNHQAGGLRPRAEKLREMILDYLEVEDEILMYDL